MVDWKKVTVGLYEQMNEVQIIFTLLILVIINIYDDILVNVCGSKKVAFPHREVLKLFCLPVMSMARSLMRCPTIA